MRGAAGGVAGVGCAGAAVARRLAQAPAGRRQQSQRGGRARRLARAALLQCWLRIAPQRRRGAGALLRGDRSAGGLGRRLGRQRRQGGKGAQLRRQAPADGGLRACSCYSARRASTRVEGPLLGQQGLPVGQVALQAQLPGAGQRGAGRGLRRISLSRACGQLRPGAGAGQGLV